MGKRLGSGLLGMLVMLVLVMGLSACKVIEEEEDSQVPGLADMRFILVRPGTFLMGSPVGELGRPEFEADETQHEVTIDHDFYLQESEVTQDQWRQIMGYNPSLNSSCSQCPVTNVSWSEVQTFISALSSEKQKTFRLPTEAEWEYAARGGSTTAFANGGISEETCNDDTNLDELGWYCFNSADTSHAVMGKLDNNFNVYDMHGNVAEWVQDWYGGDYEADPVTNPTGPDTGTNRVARGGGWQSLPPACRSAARAYHTPSYKGNDLGFRLVWEP